MLGAIELTFEPVSQQILPELRSIDGLVQPVQLGSRSLQLGHLTIAQTAFPANLMLWLGLKTPPPRIGPHLDRYEVEHHTD
jgi:hypothetical protein